MYLDDGESFDYKSGKYLLVKFEFKDYKEITFEILHCDPGLSFINVFWQGIYLYDFKERKPKEIKLITSNSKETTQKIIDFNDYEVRKNLFLLEIKDLMISICKSFTILIAFHDSKES